MNSILNPLITSRDDLAAYVWEALSTDPSPQTIDLDALVEAIRVRAEVEYGVTRAKDIDARLSQDEFYALVVAHDRAQGS